MNSTNNILSIVIITSLLVIGTSLTPVPSFADRDDDDEDKKTKDTNSQKDKEDADLHLDQENFCYRSDGCQQGNEGQQIVGEDNDATGFNDQSKNAPQTPSSETGPVATTPVVTPPSKGACDNGQVEITGTVGAGIQIKGCISSSLVFLFQSIPVPNTEGQCLGSLVPASITIGTGNPITYCVNRV